MRRNFRNPLIAAAMFAALGGSGVSFAQQESRNADDRQGMMHSAEMMSMMQRMQEMMANMERMMERCQGMMAQMQQQDARTDAESESREDRR